MSNLIWKNIFAFCAETAIDKDYVPYDEVYEHLDELNSAFHELFGCDFGDASGLPFTVDEATHSYAKPEDTADEPVDFEFEWCVGDQLSDARITDDHPAYFVVTKIEHNALHLIDTVTRQPVVWTYEEANNWRGYIKRAD